MSEKYNSDEYWGVRFSNLLMPSVGMNSEMSCYIALLGESVDGQGSVKAYVLWRL